MKEKIKCPICGGNAYLTEDKKHYLCLSCVAYAVDIDGNMPEYLPLDLGEDDDG